MSFETTPAQKHVTIIGNKSVPKIMLYETIKLFRKATFDMEGQTTTVSECCLITLLTDNFSIPYFCLGNGQFYEPALCQLYRHTLVPYQQVSSNCADSKRIFIFCISFHRKYYTNTTKSKSILSPETTGDQKWKLVTTRT